VKGDTLQGPFCDSLQAYSSTSLNIISNINVQAITQKPKLNIGYKVDTKSLNVYSSLLTMSYI
jgi:hypothetical protein